MLILTIIQTLYDRKMIFGYYSHLDQISHGVETTHPENPLRVISINAYLETTGLINDLVAQTAEITDKDILLVHTPGYLQELKNISQKMALYMQPQTPPCCQDIQCSLLSSGCAISALNLKVKKFIELFAVFAHPDTTPQNKTMGFCYLNHIAIAAKAQKDFGFRRVLLIDFDVHQCNGTMGMYKITKMC